MEQHNKDEIWQGFWMMLIVAAGFSLGSFGLVAGALLAAKLFR